MNKLAEEPLSGWVQDGETIRIDLADDASGLIFETVRKEEIMTSDLMHQVPASEKKAVVPLGVERLFHDPTSSLVIPDRVRDPSV